MIQLNLLPAVKMAFLKAQRTRRLVMTVSVLVTAGALILLLALLSANGLQKRHLDALNTDITDKSQELKDQPQIGKVLTVQNQLESLTQLHSQKPAASRLFVYLNQVTPASVSITSFSIDFTQQTVELSGAADSLSSVNKYVDTLKFTKYAEGGDAEAAGAAFGSVVLSSFGLSPQSSNAKPATYSITMTYDTAIFDSAREIKLSVPQQVTTRSALENPAALFENAPTNQAAGTEVQ